jgi:hypothetical protein
MEVGCTEYGVQPTALSTLTEVIIPCTHIDTSLNRTNEANLRECGKFKIVPVGHLVVIIKCSECFKIVKVI